MLVSDTEGPGAQAWLYIEIRDAPFDIWGGGGGLEKNWKKKFVSTKVRKKKFVENVGRKKKLLSELMKNMLTRKKH